VDTGYSGYNVGLKLITAQSRHLEEWKDSFTFFLTSAINGSEQAASRPRRLDPSKEALGTLRTRGLVGLRAGLDVSAKRKSLDRVGNICTE